nr:hypothetical protein CTI12_AA123990 [Tanacetum cinerariifolium]
MCGTIEKKVEVAKAKKVYWGPWKFEHLLIVNDKICATFKEACFAYGLLNDDKEWTRAIQEASLWALGPQLHDLFVTILLFCDDFSQQVKENQEKDKIGSKPDKNGKRGEAGKSLKQL